MNDRYSRQERFYGVGPAGQERLRQARVAIVGMGALGTVSASELARAGVGFLRLIDRDYVELSNLQRQLLYDEHDAEAGTPKAAAACERLRQVNSEIVLEPVLEDLTAANVEALLQDVDLVLDATDNLEVRYLINEFCADRRIPWIYGGALGAEGMTMNILPDGPCLLCLSDGIEEDSGGRTCSTVGVIGAATAIVASYQSAEAIKILTGSPKVRRTLIHFDLWQNRWVDERIDKQPDCPVCALRQYRHLGTVSGVRTDPLCGRDSIQVAPAQPRQMDFAQLQEKLQPMGTVRVSAYCLDFDSPAASFKLFRDGRAIVRHVQSEGRAKSVYAEYIGF